MTAVDHVRRLIADKENKSTDFKLMLDFAQEKHKQGLAVDVVSFANADGGTIVVGVDDHTRNVTGISRALNTDQVVNSIIERTEPPVDVKIEHVNIDGRLVGLIGIPKGKTVHRLRNDRSVYVRRDGINYKATPEEVVRLYDERDPASRVYLSEREKLYSSENSVFMLSGEVLPYKKIRKSGSLGQLAQCVLFLPEFSDITPAPEFGGTKGCFLVSYPNVVPITHHEFVGQVRESESQFGVLGHYFGSVDPAIFYWSISSDGWLCLGCGSDSLAKALDDGERGVITVAACGEYRGAEEQRSTLLLIGGYAKSREGNLTYVQDREVRLYLSSIPISPGWVRSLFAPFVNEERLPFSILSYELVHPRLRVWRPLDVSRLGIPIRGVIRKYRHSPNYPAQIGGAIGKTDWFRTGLYRIDTEWKGGNPHGDKAPVDRFFEEVQRSVEVQDCPLQLLDECVVFLAPPAVFYDEIEEGKTKAFRLPSVKDFEVRMRGYSVHVLGLNASPIEEG
jgi:hypothetical protein